MDLIYEYLPWLSAMLVLIAGSAFFSGSEAAFFYLRRSEVRRLSAGNTSQQIAAGLLNDPDRLLTAVLFWNLVINVSYFAIASILALRLTAQASGGSLAVVFSLAALLTIIFFSEMLPKSVAVISPRPIATMAAIPMAVCVRLIGPLMPLMRNINLFSRRLIWPSFQPEPYIEVADLEQAIQLSTTDAELLEQEQRVLQQIVQLSDTRVDELMRPRIQTETFRPPVSIEDLRRRFPPSGYLLITEPDSDEVAGAVSLSALNAVPATHLEHKAESVLYVPWCTSAAEALDEMENRDREVAAIVNEHGETIGVLTYDDILDTIFSTKATPSDRLLNRRPIQQVHPGLWHVTGMTTLRRLSKYFETELPETKSVTLAGVLQEVLQRLPEAADECDWGPFHFHVLESPERGRTLLALTWTGEREVQA